LCVCLCVFVCFCVCVCVCALSALLPARANTCDVCEK